MKSRGSNAISHHHSLNSSSHKIHLTSLPLIFVIASSSIGPYFAHYGVFLHNGLLGITFLRSGCSATSRVFFPFQLVRKAAQLLLLWLVSLGVGSVDQRPM